MRRLPRAGRESGRLLYLRPRRRTAADRPRRPSPARLLQRLPASRRPRRRSLRRAKDLARAAGFGDGAGAMPADVVEAAQGLGVADDQQRFAGEVEGKVVARIRDLLAVADALPRLKEDAVAFARQD